MLKGRFFQTLYALDAVVEPAKGNEFCRVGVVCHLHLTISSMMPVVHGKENADVRSVMYEVLAEQSVWAVCGRTAGVISFGGILGKMQLTQRMFNCSVICRISRFRPESTIQVFTRNKLRDLGSTLPNNFVLGISVV